jgi:hypothetical protein
MARRRHPCDEHTELKWFSVSEMRGLADIVDPDYVSFAELAMTDKATWESDSKKRSINSGIADSFVMPGLVPGIHVLAVVQHERRGWPGQARP